MSRILPRKYRIVSYEEGNPPTAVRAVPLPVQNVVLDEFEQVWTLTEVPGDQVFLFSLAGYPLTFVANDRVNVGVEGQGQNVKWHVTYFEHLRAHRIEPDENRDVAWTVKNLLGGLPEIVIEGILPQGSTQLPGFAPQQLFKFEPVD